MPQRYSLAPNQTPTTLLGIAIGTGGSVWAWYQDGTVSKGTATDLDSLQAPQPFSGRLDENDSWETLTPGDVLSINILYP